MTPKITVFFLLTTFKALLPGDYKPYHHQINKVSFGTF